MQSSVLSEGAAAVLGSLLSFMSRPSGRNAGRVQRLSSAYARHAADEALGAADLQELLDYIDVLTGDEQIWLEEVGLDPRPPSLEKPPSLAGAADDITLDLDVLRRILGVGPVRRLEEGLAALKWDLHIVAAFLDSLPQPTFDEATAEDFRRFHADNPTPYGYLYDLKIPAVVRTVVTGLLRFFVVSMLIGRAEELGAPVAPWISLALADEWSSGPLQLREALHDARALPLGLARLNEDAGSARELEALFRQWAAQASERSEKGWFFPFGEDFR